MNKIRSIRQYVRNMYLSFRKQKFNILNGLQMCCLHKEKNADVIVMNF